MSQLDPLPTQPHPTQPHPAPQPPAAAAAAHPSAPSPWAPGPPPADPLPAGPPRPYPQLLRGVGHRWWRPLLSLAAVGVGLLLVFLAALAAFGVGILLDPVALGLDLTTDEGSTALLSRWWALLISNLLLAAGIPLAGLAVWAGWWVWRPRWVSSVVGGLRWRWMLVAAGAALLVTSAGTAAFFALDPSPYAPERDLALLLAVVLLTTPLQAAGEEYFFRGWMTQAIGSLFARPLAGALVAGAVSATTFALAHGSQGPWLFADRFAFGVVASLLVWRTGGLEAAIAVHALNNVVVFIPTVLTGGLADVLTVTDTTWQVFVVDVLTLAVLVVVIDVLARRRGLQRTQSAPRPPRARRGREVRHAA